MNPKLKSALDKSFHDKLKGGLADKKKPSQFDPAALAKGIKVEREHTKDPRIAEEIAMDHLTEDPKYYDKLEKMEKEAFWKGFFSKKNEKNYTNGVHNTSGSPIEVDFWSGFEKQAGKVGNYINSLKLSPSNTKELRGKLAKNIVKARNYLRSKSAPIERVRGVHASLKDDKSKFTVGSTVARKGANRTSPVAFLGNPPREVKVTEKSKRSTLAPSYRLIGPR